MIITDATLPLRSILRPNYKVPPSEDISVDASESYRLRVAEEVKARRMNTTITAAATNEVAAVTAALIPLVRGAVQMAAITAASMISVSTRPMTSGQGISGWDCEVFLK